MTTKRSPIYNLLKQLSEFTFSEIIIEKTFGKQILQTNLKYSVHIYNILKARLTVQYLEICSFSEYTAVFYNGGQPFDPIRANKS